ncbi:hypothetical protein LCGC14_1265090 [marine sediment metagenome]|uniref:Uncharacterized protein n=1 Tax=marine sediment metagenome TaxID=412755 RepID=A0A0F9NGJ1_9ZZZZ
MCFCTYDAYLRNRCVCRDKFDCPEAMVEVTVIPGTRPSEQDLAPLRKAERTIKKVTKNINSIKKGISRLERDMRKFPIK